MTGHPLEDPLEVLGLRPARPANDGAPFAHELGDRAVLAEMLAHANDELGADRARQLLESSRFGRAPPPFHTRDRGPRRAHPFGQLGQGQARLCRAEELRSPLIDRSCTRRRH